MLSEEENSRVISFYPTKPDTVTPNDYLLVSGNVSAWHQDKQVLTSEVAVSFQSKAIQSEM